MPAQLTTRAQVNGYRFLLKRYEHALVRRDVRMLHDPMRSHLTSLVAGAVLGTLIVAGAAILAFFRPQGAVGDAKILMTKNSGALYVVVGDTVHPVLNLASARLIAGVPENPTSVAESKLTQPRGPLLGIPAAPGALPGPADPGRSSWTVCDSVQLSATGSAAGSPGAETTVIAGALDSTGPHARPLDPDQALLVSRSGKTYLVFEGKRAELDPNDSVLARTLALRGTTARPASAGLFAATEPVPALAVPHIDELGAPGPGKLSGTPVGAVVRVRDVDTDELYVVLGDAVQRVSPFTAELLRNANSMGQNEIVTVPPDRIVGVPVVNRLPVDRFPTRIPRLVATDPAPVSCLSWAAARGDAAATVTVLAGRALPLADDDKPVITASADGVGDRVDAVYLRPGTGEFVQSVGMAPGSVDFGPSFYVGDNGIRYGIPDAAAQAMLGLPKAAEPAPKPILEALTAGPTLARADALMAHDTLPQCPNPADDPGTCARPIAPPVAH